VGATTPRKPFSWKRLVIVTTSGVTGAFVGMMVATFGALIDGDSASALNDRLGQGFGFGIAAAAAVAIYATRRNR
jgi:Mn2+/Fe2+ NRAMP family transporter